MAAEVFDGLSRRQLLQMLAVIGMTGSAAAEVAAQQPAPRISVDTLRNAEAILGEQYTPERLQVIERALQRNLDQFQIVRDLQIDDLVEPAPIFMAKGW